MFLTRKYCLALVVISLTIGYSCKQPNPTPSPTTTIKPAVNGVDEKIRRYNMDKSPMDMVYFPDDFPVLKMSGKVKGDPIARVIYSRPSKDGRQIFGNVVKYGTYWRMGANEGTEIEFFTDVMIQGKRVKKGRYILYCIPFENKWTLKLNGDLYTWGLRIHKSLDIYSFDIPVEKSNSIFEVLTMQFERFDGGARLNIGWDSVKAGLPFKY